MLDITLRGDCTCKVAQLACCLARVNYASRDPSFWGGFRWIVRPVECNVGSQPVSFAHHKVPENVFAGEENLTDRVKSADMFVD